MSSPLTYLVTLAPSFELLSLRDLAPLVFTVPAKQRCRATIQPVPNDSDPLPFACYVKGILVHNSPGEVLLHRCGFAVGDLLTGSVDVATFNVSDSLYCPFPIGKITATRPMLLEFEAIDDVERQLSLTLFYNLHTTPPPAVPTE